MESKTWIDSDKFYILYIDYINSIMIENIWEQATVYVTSANQEKFMIPKLIKNKNWLFHPK